MKACTLLLVGASLTLCQPLLAEEHQSHDAHEHGHGQLNLALDGSQLLIEFQAPAADLVGFETNPTTAQEKRHYAESLAHLRQATTLFNLPAEAGCTLKEQQVGGHNDNHEVTPEAASQPESKAHEHSDIHAEYRFECQAPQKLTSMAVTLFGDYPSLEKLSVQAIVPGTPSSIELTPANPTLRW